MIYIQYYPKVVNVLPFYVLVYEKLLGFVCNGKPSNETHYIPRKLIKD